MTDLNNSSNTLDLDLAKGMGLFTADHLLFNSPFYGEVIKLRDNLSRNSDGNIIDYDAATKRLRDEVTDLPTLELQMSVPSGTESAYQRQLLHALEKINDDHDRVLHKLFKIKSRLANAVTLMKIQRSQFVAFFSLAFPIAVHELNIPNFKLSVKAIEKIAEGEYSRVMDALDMAAPSTISELEILEREIKRRKAAQADKYQMGKEQVNLMWHSIQSNGAISLDDEPSALLKKLPIEEDEDEIPSFVSRHTKEVRVGASIKRPEPEIKGTFFKQGDPKPVTPFVDDDGEIFIVGHLLPNGEYEDDLTDKEKLVTNGSVTLGAPPVALNQPISLPVVSFKPWSVTELTDQMLNPTKPVLIEDIEGIPSQSKAASAPLEKPTLVEDIESFLNRPEPLATPALSEPRKRLVLLDGDEL